MKTTHTAIVCFNFRPMSLIAAAVSVFEPGLLAARPGGALPPDIVVTTAELETPRSARGALAAPGPRR